MAIRTRPFSKRFQEIYLDSVNCIPKHTCQIWSL